MYDKVKLVDDLKKAHADFVADLENELYVRCAEKPENMTTAAHESYKQLLAAKIADARETLDKFSGLRATAFRRNDPAGLTAIIHVQYSNPRMEPHTSMVVFQTKIPDALLRKYNFPIGLCWRLFPGRKAGEKIKMESEGRGETHPFHAVITSIE